MAQPGSVEEYLKSIPLFALTGPEDRLEILRLLHPVDLKPGQVLFQQGEPGHAMWVLGAGVEVTVSAVAPGAERLEVIAQARGGDTLGEMALIDDGARSGTALVVRGGPAHQIDAIDFATLRDAASPPIFKILRKLCLELATKLRATSNRVGPAGARPPDAPPLPSGRRPSPSDVDAFVPFQRLPQVVKLAMALKLSLHDFPDVTPLFDEGDEADSAFFVLSGEVTVARSGTTLATLGPGSVLGLVALLDRGLRSASCLTSPGTRLLRLARSDFDLLFHASNTFAFNLVELISRQLVAHLRATTEMVAAPGKAPALAPVATPQPAVREEDFLPDVEILPLELEMEVRPDFRS